MSQAAINNTGGKIETPEEYWQSRYSTGKYLWGNLPSKVVEVFFDYVDNKKIPEKARVADVGSGYCKDAFEIHAHKHNVIAIEPSYNALALSKKFAMDTGIDDYESLITINSSFASAPIGEAELEVLLSHRTWHLSSNGTTRAMNRKVEKVVAPGGTIIISARSTKDFKKDTMYYDGNGLARYKTDIEGYEDRSHHVLNLYDRNKFKEEFGRGFEDFKFFDTTEIESIDKPDVTTEILIMAATRKMPSPK